MDLDEKYMLRCIELAQFGAGNVAPNPLVGAVLVHNSVIIGEGYHMQYGHAHAEVNCIASVQAEDKEKIAISTLYVSLEPCAHFGKTPPCADLIISKGIRKVIIGCRDPFEAVNGKGIEKLLAAGIEVEIGVLENACTALNKRFFTFHTKKRPYIILKWAESSNGCIANADFSAVPISNDYSNRLVHQWRSEEAAIMVGTNTALHDNPSLTTRLWPGKNPIRVLLDKDLKTPSSNKIFDVAAPTLVLNQQQQSEDIKSLLQQNKTAYMQLQNIKDISAICTALYKLHINSVLVEGGTQLLQNFINAGLWDEARIIKSNTIIIDNGLAAPDLQNATTKNQLQILDDTITFHQHKQLI